MTSRVIIDGVEVGTVPSPEHLQIRDNALVLILTDGVAAGYNNWSEFLIEPLEDNEPEG